MKKIIITFSDDIPIYAIRGMAKNIRNSYVDYLSVDVFTECAANTKEKTGTSPKQSTPCCECRRELCGSRGSTVGHCRIFLPR